MTCGCLSPQPVGLLGFEIPIVDDLIDAGIDIVGGVLEAVGLDGAAAWLEEEVRDVINDPRMAALALSTAATCVGLPALCPAALSTAKGILAAEAVARFGPQRWGELAASEARAALAGEVAGRVPGGPGGHTWTAGTLEAQRQLIARAEGPVLQALMTGGRAGTWRYAPQLERLAVVERSSPALDVRAGVLAAVAADRERQIAALQRAAPFYRKAEPAPVLVLSLAGAGSAILWKLLRKKR